MCQEINDIGIQHRVWQLQRGVIRGGSVMRLCYAVVLAASLLCGPAAAQTAVHTSPNRLAGPGNLGSG